jgi:hypothetical protein
MKLACEAIADAHGGTPIQLRVVLGVMLCNYKKDVFSGRTRRCAPTVEEITICFLTCHWGNVGLKAQ